MSLIDDIRKDREAGATGPWVIHDCENYGDRNVSFYQEIWNDETDILVTSEVTRAHNDGGKANVRRCARVPEMEAALLAAEELADAISRSDPWEEIDKAMNAYREATK